LAAVLFLLLPAAALATAPAFDSSFDGSDTPANAFSTTATTNGVGRVAVDEATGDVYVVDRGNNVVDKFTASGSYICQITGMGSNTTSASECDATSAPTTAGVFSFDQFATPESDIIVDNNPGPNQGNVYVSVEGQGIVAAFDSSGQFLWEHDFGGSADICGVGVDPSGNIWASDYNGGAINELQASDGSAIGTSVSTTASGQAQPGCHIAFDSAGNLYVAQWQGFSFAVGNNEVDKYTSGALVTPPLDTLAGTFAIGVDSYFNNDVYLAQHNQVAVYDAGGSAVSGTPFDGTATPANSFDTAGVAINGVTGKIYVSDAANGVVDIYDGPPAPPKHTVTVHTAGTGSGTVTSGPSGVDCPTPASDPGCTHDFFDGTDVTLTPTPDAHSVFTGWSGGCSGMTCEFNSLGADEDVTATFAKVQHTLTVVKDGSGTGSVGSAPAGIDCGGTCASAFDEASSVTLTATPSGGSTFVGWSGGGCSGTGTCHVTLNADTTVHAQFDPPVTSTSTTTTTTPTTTTPTTTTTPPAPVCHKITVGGKLKFKKGKASLKLTAVGDPGSTCSGKFVLSVKVKSGKKTKTIVIVRTSVSLAAGQSKTITVKLPKSLKKALERGLKATATGPGLKATVKLGGK
jgi:hypothetical protein